MDLVLQVLRFVVGCCQALHSLHEHESNESTRYSRHAAEFFFIVNVSGLDFVKKLHLFN
jgi:hypothetical protein